MNIKLILKFISFLALQFFLFSCTSTPTKTSVAAEPKKPLSTSSILVGRYTEANRSLLNQVLTSLDNLEKKPDFETTPYTLFFKTDELTAVRKFIQKNTRAWTFDQELSQKLYESLGEKFNADADAANFSAFIIEKSFNNEANQEKIKNILGQSYSRFINGFIYTNLNAEKLTQENLKERQNASILAISTLAHESMHRPCENINLLMQKNSDESELNRCSFYHAKCLNAAEGDEQFECDANLWGPYTLNYVVLTEAAARCGDRSQLCSRPKLIFLGLTHLLQVNELSDEFKTRIKDVLKTSEKELPLEDRKKFMTDVTKLTSEIDQFLIKNYPLQN